MKIPRRISLVEALIILFIIGILASLLSPQIANDLSRERLAQTRNDVTQIATALTAYETEYDHPLTSTNGLVDGELLSILVGSNLTLNPRKITFIEVNIAKEGKRSGQRADGTFVDFWGGPYRIAIASGTNTSVIAGTNQIVVPKKIAVWNDPATHPDWASDAKKNRRYVTSWE